MARAGLTVALAAALACTSGSKGGPGEAGLGRLVAGGDVRALAASPDGAWLAYLEACSEARVAFLPPRTANCDLRVVSSGGGDALVVARAVTTLPHGFAWGPGGVLAALAGYDYGAGAGELVLARGAGKGETVAANVTFHGFVPGDREGKVAAIADGRLVVAAPGGARAWAGAADALGTFELAPREGAGEVALLLRRRATAGGALLAAPAGGATARLVAEGTGEYRFAPSGRAFAYTVRTSEGYELRLAAGPRTVALGRHAGAFAFAREGDAIAFVAGARPGKQGDLHVAGLDGGRGAVAGKEVGEFRWAARAPRLAWLERYDPRVRAGTLGAGGPGVAARTFASNVTDFDLSPDGKHLAWLQHTTRGGYSVDLALAALDAPAESKPTVVAQGVFGFDFSPDGAWLYYRTRCTRNAEACVLERIPAAGLAPGAQPEAIAAGV